MFLSVSLRNDLSCCSVQAQSQAPETVSQCVWALHGNLTGGPDRAQQAPITPAQRWEMWAQYAALQIALQVRASVQLPYCHSQSTYGIILFQHPSVYASVSSLLFLNLSQAYQDSLTQMEDTSLSGLYHNRLFFAAFSQVW